MKWLFIFLVMLFVSSCDTKSKYEKYLSEQLVSNYPLKELNKYDFIVVIPRRGCHSCIKSAEKFFYENRSKKGFLFIFTRVDSSKKLGLEIGKDNLEKENVKIDLNSIFYNKQINDSAYPLLIINNKNGQFKYKKLVIV